MDTKASYTLVGLFVILLTCLAVGIVLWLTWFRHNQTYTPYTVYMQQEVSGLSIQSPVRFNGVRVGYVSAIKLAPKDLQEVKLTIMLDSSVPITTGVVATLMSQGITGLDYVGLSSDSPDAPLLKVKEGEKYPVIPSKPSLLKQLSEMLEDITKDISAVSHSVTALFSEKNQRNVSDMLAGFASFAQVLEDNSNTLDSSLKSAKTVLSNTAKASEQFPGVMKNLQTTATSVQNLTFELQKTTRKMTKVMGSSEVAIQGLTDQLFPSITALMQHLNQMSGELEGLMGELDQQPSTMIRKINREPLGPGERR